MWFRFARRLDAIAFTRDNDPASQAVISSASQAPERGLLRAGDNLPQWRAERGIDLDLRVLDSTSRRLKMRMASLRLDPKTHPIAGDTRSNLLLKGIRASFREPDLCAQIAASSGAVVRADGCRADGTRNAARRTCTINFTTFARR